MKKDYCTLFPETFRGINISPCCKEHDNLVGEKGGYNPVTPHIVFYKCLKEKGITKTWSFIIALVGGLASVVRYPYFAYKKWAYRRQKIGDK